MSRFAGIKNTNIFIVSDKKISSNEFTIVEIPSELDSASQKDLILNYRFKNNTFVNKFSKKLAKDLRVAFISNYGSQCGIGTYSKFLFNEIVKHIGDYKIFAEDTVYLENSTDLLPKDKIINCWRRGESLIQLVAEIKKYDPDVILIQHEFGLFPNARYWISMMNQLSDYRVIATMHSIFYHQDKTIIEACIPEIVVHLEGAKNVLKNVKQISGEVYVIPHGCFPCTDKSKMWNFYKSEHTFIQAGFLFKYKGFENSIKATAILKEKYSDVYFTGVCSENGFSKLDHQNYYNELMELIDSLSLHENVGLVRGYQSDAVLNSYLRMNRAAIFPYVSHKEHECFGSSGAAPYTMTKGIPVITSSIHHFKDLPSIKADTPEQIANELDKLFSDWKYTENQIIKQNEYLEANSWANVALRYIKIFER